jgi:predicted ribosome quality control (RQC) complex YloA/Tae2 family protein
MRLRLFYNKSVHENAAYYYQLAKETRKKIQGLEEAIKQTEKEMEGQSRTKEKEVRVKREKAWYEKFNFGFTSGGRLMIGGRSAQQNDQVFGRHMEDNDLFFHADIQGGSAVILKDGIAASEGELNEAAQFAASFSKAWVNGNAAVDVYAVRKGQLSKHAQSGFIPTGAFAITGERTWFRSTPLRLRIGLGDSGLRIVADCSQTRIKDELVLVPAQKGKAKGAIAKSLAKRFKVHADDLLQILPNGKTRTIQE